MLQKETLGSEKSQVPFFAGRFKAASEFYTTGRPTYPVLLSRRVAALVGLTSSDAVLDLGTGPGFLAIDFAPLARSVTAVEPAAEMLAVAQANVAKAGVAVRLIHARAEELTQEVGRFKLATIGRAFHWLDRKKSLSILDGLLEVGGAVVLFGERYPEVPANAWQPEFQALIDSYSTADPARPLIHASVKHETVLLESAFDQLERVAVLERRETSIERFVDRALSFASTWEGRPGSRSEDLAHEVRKLIGKYADARGIVNEVLEGQALVARRSRDLAAS
jgi:SAM-dependent methyltransferase